MVEKGDINILRLLLDRYQEILRTSLGRALTATILFDRNDATEMLLTAGANVNGDKDLDNVEFDPLSAAISRKNSRLIRRLLDAGADVSAITALIYWPTALEVASRNNDLRMVQSLLCLGAEPDE